MVDVDWELWDGLPDMKPDLHGRAELDLNECRPGHGRRGPRGGRVGRPLRLGAALLRLGCEARGGVADVEQWYIGNGFGHTGMGYATGVAAPLGTAAL